MTYAAALAARTKNVMTVATVHAPVVHPFVAAKAVATIDHVSGGRAALNIVMGWYADEMKMLGLELLGHVDRYGYGREWMNIVDGLWSREERFDFKGEHFDLVGCEAMPKPIQKRPVVINAGGSPAGIEFSARHADFNFTNFVNEDQARRYAARIRELAGGYGRKIGILTMVVVVCRDTEKEARDAYQSILDHGDWVAANNYIAGLSINPGAHSEHMRQEFLAKFVAGAGGHSLVGTPEQVAEGFQAIKDAGIDGVFLGLIDYVRELPYFADKVMPLLQQRGIRL
jgi:alkanesulfonate monooxygenase SsuD/methylene tetrahydromethanopterin reductase-like flavin-dependent oxidoreductase (luciferase family)